MLPDCRCILQVRKPLIVSGEEQLRKCADRRASLQGVALRSPGDGKGGLRLTEALFRGNIAEALGLDPCALVDAEPLLFLEVGHGLVQSAWKRDIYI